MKRSKGRPIKDKPTLCEFMDMYPQLQLYYRKKYPEMNYLSKNEIDDIRNKPTLEQFLNLPHSLRRKWRRKFPNDYPPLKKHKNPRKKLDIKE